MALRALATVRAFAREPPACMRTAFHSACARTRVPTCLACLPTAGARADHRETPLGRISDVFQDCNNNDNSNNYYICDNNTH